MAIVRRWLVGSQQSWDADWFARAVSDQVLLRVRSFQLQLMAKHEVMVLACQVGPFHLTLIQINSEINCTAKNKCRESQKLDTRRRGENLNAHLTRAKSNNMYIFAFFVFDLLYVRQEKRQKIFLSFWNSLILSNVCFIIGTRPTSDSITRRLDKVQ